MFTLGMTLLIIATLALATMTLFGILQYRDTSSDDDSDKTVKDLFKIFGGLVIVIILSVGIMGYSHYTEGPNVKHVQVETNK